MAKVTQEWCDERRGMLPGELLEMIGREPGRPKTEYLHRPLDKGGLRGLTDDKYAAFEGLIAQGLIAFGPDSRGRWNVRGVYLTAGGAPAVATEGEEPELSDERLMGWLMGEVERDPGRGPSHYPRVTRAEGSPGGSQARKEALLKRLIAEGRLRLEKLPQPRGRRATGVFPAEGLAFCGGVGL